MHSPVRQTPERLLRQVGTLLILLLLVGPLASVRPAPAAAQDAEPPAELIERWSYEGSDFFEGNPQVSNGVVLATTADSIVHAVDNETGDGLWQTETGYVNRPYMQVADELLFTISEGPLALHALDITAEGADERWSVEFPSTVQPVAARPAVTEDGLVLMMLDLGGTRNWQIVALDSEDGSEQWSVDLSEYIYGSGYAYADGVIVVGMEEGLTGLDAATGDELWQVDLDPTSVMLVVGGGAIYGAVRESDELFALDLASGGELWNVSAPTSANRPVAYGDGLVFINHPLTVEDERVQGILALDAETGDERFTIASVVGEVTAAVALDGLFYLAGDETVGQDGALEVYASDDGTLLARTVINATGVGVDPGTGAIYANTRGPDGDLLRAYQGVQEGSGSGEEAGSGDDAASGQGPLDLAAMALTPWDLADAGLDNYGHGYSEMVFLDAFASGIASARDAPVDEVREQLVDVGFIRAYNAYFYSPAEDENTAQTVSSYVVEYADDEGAADAWALLEDESDLEDAEDLNGFDGFGDASEATLHAGEDPATGNPYAQLDTTVQIGNLHVGVSIIDWNAETPDEELAAELIEYALEAVEAGRDAGQPALSNQMIRLAGESVTGYLDTYQMRNGEAIWFYGESPEVGNADTDAAAELGKIEEYRLIQEITSERGDPADSVWFYITLTRYESAESAGAWLESWPGRIEAYEGWTEIEFDEPEPAFGDAAIGYTAQTSDGTIFRGITVQVGTLTVMVDLAGPLEPALESVEALTEEQLACIENEGCPEPIEQPGELEDYLGEIDDSAAPDGEETPEAGDTPEAEETPEEEETEQPVGGPALYQSDLYGFSIEYNTNDWQLTLEDDPDGDEYEWLTFSNDVSTVWMVGDPDFNEDELGDCIEYYIESQGWADAWEMEPLDELTVENGRASASYTMVDQLFGLFGYLSVECRSIDSSTALAIMHFAGTDAEGEVPDEEIEQAQELVAGLQFSSSGDDDGSNEGDDEEAASTATGDSYTSEQWGYTVTWDPAQWSLRDNSFPDGIMLELVGSEVTTLVTITGEEARNSDPATCLEDQVETSDAMTSGDFVATDDLPAPATADGAVGGVYLIGDGLVFYFECRTLVDGEAVLQIGYRSDEQHWMEYLPVLEELLANIEITTD